MNYSIADIGDKSANRGSTSRVSLARHITPVYVTCTRCKLDQAFATNDLIHVKHLT